MARIVVNAEIRARQEREDLPPVGRGGHEVLPAGPLVAAEEHGAVFNGDPDAELLREGDYRRPDLLHKLKVLLDTLRLLPADKGRHQIHAELRARADDRLEMRDVRRALFGVAVERVGVEGERGDLHALLRGVSEDLPGVSAVGTDAVNVDVADAGVAALRLAGGPAGDLHAFNAQGGDGIYHLLVIIFVENRGNKAKLHGNSPLIRCRDA